MKRIVRLAAVLMPLLLSAACAPAHVPDGRSVSVPTVTPPLDRYKGLNEQRDPITRVRLGKDVLVPLKVEQDPLPDEVVGPYELRGETLASALQLVLDDYDITLAFESDKAMTARISVANLRGKISSVVARMCDLANLYCSYKDRVLTVKDTETFMVDLPPLSASSDSSSSSSGATAGATAGASSGGDSSAVFEQISAGLQAITGSSPTVDKTMRVMIYSATQRSQKYAERYFDRLRKNTALIVYETHIWEVALNNDNRTGIDWSALVGNAVPGNTGNFGLNLAFPGGSPDGPASPISITPTYTGSGLINPTAVLDFISEHGTVKTVSQPQLTVLAGSSATLNVTGHVNFVSGTTRIPSTVVGTPDTVTTTTGTANTGLTMTVASAWDQSTVYGTVSITINDLLSLDSFKPDPNTTVQLPNEASRSLQTQVRVRPGDAILIGGLVTQKDSYAGSGPGLMSPLFTTSREVKNSNTELVFLLRPRVVAFVPGDADDTPPIADAPGQGHPAGPPKNITREMNGLFGAGSSAPAPEVPSPSPLPDGISPIELAPLPAEKSGGADGGETP